MQSCMWPCLKCSGLLMIYKTNESPSKIAVMYTKHSILIIFQFFQILAVCHKIREITQIGVKLDNHKCRQWTYVAADAAIALLQNA